MSAGVAADHDRTRRVDRRGAGDAYDRVPLRQMPRLGEARERGFFDLLLVGKDGGAEIRARIRGDRDPGYGATSRMLGEAALCLASDALSVGGGIWTPASALAAAPA